MPLVSGATYHPFGGLSGFTFGSAGPLYTRARDLDGRVAGYRLGAATYNLDHDDAGNLTRISDLALQLVHRRQC